MYRKQKFRNELRGPSARHPMRDFRLGDSRGRIYGTNVEAGKNLRVNDPCPLPIKAGVREGKRKGLLLWKLDARQGGIDTQPGRMSIGKTVRGNISVDKREIPMSLPILID